MDTINKKDFRIMAVALSTSGFGYAVFEGNEMLVECDTKTARGDNKNAQTLKKVEKLIAHFQPDVLILENTSVKDSRRWQRIRILSQQIIKLARDGKVEVKLISRERVMKTFFPAGDGTRHAMAEAIAKMFSEQLKAQLPPKRKLWDSENHRMSMFDAVALGTVFQLKN